jgi:outer membrane protein assembly factor BamB
MKRFSNAKIYLILWSGISILVGITDPVYAGENDIYDWPQFHGPQRDNISQETGLLKQWPSEGPKLVWQAEGIGEGYATVALVQGRIYTTGNINKDTVITCLDRNGKTKWTVKNGPAYKRSQPGTRCTPTIDNGKLYHENADGDILCLDAVTSKKIWSLNILETFKGRNIDWGLSESLLIDGDHLICTPGGENAGMVALNKHTGETVWICKEIADKPGYCSPIVFDYDGIRQIVTLMAKSIVGVSARTGELLWKVKHTTPFDENINSPIFYNGNIIVSTRTTGTRFFRLQVDNKKGFIEQVWHTDFLESQHGGILLLDHFLYGACRSNSLGPWVCLDVRTGKRTYAEKGIGVGSFTYADGLFTTLNHKGTVALVKPNPHSFEIISQFNIPTKGKGPTWAHPVICNGRLYIRHSNFLYCYDIKHK